MAFLKDLIVTGASRFMGPIYTAGGQVLTTSDIGNLGGASYYAITEDMMTITKNETAGVAPYNTSYKYTDIVIKADAGIAWREGALYSFVLTSSRPIESNYRNVRFRIEGIDSSSTWHPLMNTSAALSGYDYMTKDQLRLFMYKSTYVNTGALHFYTDSNSTYNQLQNTIVHDTTDASVTIDANGYGARYSLIFPTTAMATTEKWSSLVTSSGNGTTKAIVTPASGKFYIDRAPQYIYSANIAKGAKAVNATYQYYYGTDLRYTANVSNTYLVRNSKCFLWLKNFNTTDLSFVADSTAGSIVSLSKLATKFPSTTTGDIYLYFLGWTTGTWYQLSPNINQVRRLYKYTPSSGALVSMNTLVG